MAAVAAAQLIENAPVRKIGDEARVAAIEAAERLVLAVRQLDH